MGASSVVSKSTIAFLIVSSILSAPGAVARMTGMRLFCATGGEGSCSITVTRTEVERGSHCAKMAVRSARVSFDLSSRGRILRARDLTIRSTFSWSLQ